MRESRRRKKEDLDLDLGEVIGGEGVERTLCYQEEG